VSALLHDFVDHREIGVSGDESGADALDLVGALVLAAG
jgi:hypothetical protein